MGRLNFADPDAAAQDVAELRDNHGMVDRQFQALHHRRKLGPSDGIAAHLRYLGKVQTELRAEHQQTARRFRVCLELRRAGARWPEAAKRADELFPGAQSK